MKFEHDTVLQEYGVDRKPDIRQLHKLPGIHKEPQPKDMFDEAAHAL